LRQISLLVALYHAFDFYQPHLKCLFSVLSLLNYMFHNHIFFIQHTLSVVRLCRLSLALQKLLFVYFWIHNSSFSSSSLFCQSSCICRRVHAHQPIWFAVWVAIKLSRDFLLTYLRMKGVALTIHPQRPRGSQPLCRLDMMRLPMHPSKETIQ